PGAALLTNWNIGKTTRYAADCKGPCTAGALVIPNLNDTALVVPLIPPGYEFMDRFNQLDLKFAKLFRINGVRLTGQFEVFNSLNSSAVIALRGGTGLTASSTTATGYSLTAASAGGTYFG